MLMIRLVVGSADQANWSGIAPRLRGAAIELCVDASRAHESPDACQAVVFAEPVEKEAIKRCLDARKHVLLATETCLPRDALETLSVAARTAGVQFTIVNPDRHLPSRQLIKQQIAGKLGDAALVRVHRWEPAGTEKAAHALVLPSPLLRDLEQVLWLTGKTPRLVYAVEHLAPERGVSTGRSVQVHLGFAEGMALIDYDNRLPAGAGYQCLSVIGSSGAAYADDHQNVQLVYRGGPPLAVRAEEQTRQRAALLQDFVEALAAGRDLEATVTAWRDVFIVADAVVTSLKSRQAVSVEGC